MHVLFISIFICIFASKTTSFSIENDSVSPPGQQDNNIYNLTELNCFKNFKVYFKGECHPLLTSKACYKDNEWLILDYPSAISDNPIILPKCVRKPCPNGKYYWPGDGGCYSATAAKNLCPIGKELRHNVFGEAVCKCIKTPPHESVSDGSCFQLYTRGPCKDRWVFVKFQHRVQCIYDRCYSKTSSLNKTYVFWEKSRKCYPLGEKGPCILGKVLEIDMDEKLLVCNDLVLPANLVDLPQTCSTDHQGNCNKAINFKQLDDSYILSLFLKADERREKKHKKY